MDMSNNERHYNMTIHSSGHKLAKVSEGEWDEIEWP